MALGRSLPNEDPTPSRKLKALDKMPCKALSSSDRSVRSLGMPGVQAIPTSRQDEVFAVQRGVPRKAHWSEVPALARVTDDLNRWPEGRGRTHVALETADLDSNSVLLFTSL